MKTWACEVGLRGINCASRSMGFVSLELRNKREFSGPWWMEDRFDRAFPGTDREVRQFM